MALPAKVREGPVAAVYDRRNAERPTPNCALFVIRRSMFGVQRSMFAAAVYVCEIFESLLRVQCPKNSGDAVGLQNPFNVIADESEDVLLASC